MSKNMDNPLATKLETLMTPKIAEDAPSEEIVYDKLFIKRWADRCYEVKQASGQQVANSFAQQMFSQRVLKLINDEIASRNKR